MPNDVYRTAQQQHAGVKQSTALKVLDFNEVLESIRDVCPQRDDVLEADASPAKLIAVVRPLVELANKAIGMENTANALVQAAQNADHHAAQKILAAEEACRKKIRSMETAIEARERECSQSEAARLREALNTATKDGADLVRRHREECQKLQFRIKEQDQELDFLRSSEIDDEIEEEPTAFQRVAAHVLDRLNVPRYRKVSR